MGILQRLFNLFRSNANDLLDKAEDPGKMLQQMLADLEVQKRKAKQQMTEALALQKGLERNTEKEHKLYLGHCFVTNISKLGLTMITNVYIVHEIQI